VTELYLKAATVLSNSPEDPAFAEYVKKAMN